MDSRVYKKEKYRTEGANIPRASVCAYGGNKINRNIYERMKDDDRRYWKYRPFRLYLPRITLFYAVLPSLTILNRHGSFCFPMSFNAQHCSSPKSESIRGVYLRMLVWPKSEDISRGSSFVSRPFDSVHGKLTTSGSDSTWQRSVAGWSRDTTTVNGFERRQTGASVPTIENDE